jgi:hypothetical protein
MQVTAQVGVACIVPKSLDIGAGQIDASTRTWHGSKHVRQRGRRAPLAEARREDADHDRDSVEHLVKSLGRGAHRHRVVHDHDLPRTYHDHDCIPGHPSDYPRL